MTPQRPEIGVREDVPCSDLSLVDVSTLKHGCCWW